MKKIDLHIHTISTNKDKPFNYSEIKLKEYVEKLNIDCIAITNHNIFDLNQFKEIIELLPDTKVLPGIEIDLEGGHILLISENDELEDFETKTKIISEKIKNGEIVTLVILKEIFPNLEKYLLIPHYLKEPAISSNIINGMSLLVGEVSSIKKFKVCLKLHQNLVPVIFSDIRIEEEMIDFPTKQTYIKLDELSLKGIKQCLADKSKVLLTESNDELFYATDEGLKLYNGLNVIIGKRSSGKTYTLDKIKKTFGEKAKYIQQFSLLELNEKKFDSLLTVKNGEIARDFLKEFSNVISDIKDIDLEKNDKDVTSYLDH